jgi:16S rRNA (uracil1498-N3)-methyltransferase
VNPLLRGSAAHVFVADVSAPELSPDDVHHLQKVLRLRDGEHVSCSDGQGQWRMCTWVSGSLEELGDVTTEELPTAQLRVVVAPLKGDRTDLVVEKLVEIGVDNISILAPVERSVVRWAHDKTAHVMDRYQRIARAAAMQSRRVFLPEVAGPVSLSDIGTSGVAFAEPDGTAAWGDITTVVIGPEGGFSSTELATARATIDLGPNILRAETAAIVAASQMVAHWRR